MASHGVSRTAAATERSEEARRKELQQIAAYKDLTDLVNAKISERQYTLEVLGLSTKLLNENPEYYTIWNHRRRILGALLSPQLSDTAPHKDPNELVQDDLQLTFTLLRKFPKCYWIWNHRDWLLRTAESVPGASNARTLWAGELQLIGKMLHADSRNFHAWSYRRFVVAQIERLAPPTTEASSQSLVESEFEYTTKMIKTNLSNFSAWHSRSKILPRLLKERTATAASRRALLASELSLICSAINTDPFDQSIWYYHQYLMSTISPACPAHNRLVLDLSNGERQEHYEHEMEYIREILDDETDCKWIYEALLYLASAYLEVEGGTQAFSTRDMRGWLDQLKRLDPLRKGRWEDLGSTLNV
ncbi:geranylgeranyl transferase type 2 subunit alpha [Massariosphaeria phaeospora]|uniref:Geranylgeranyl transferase type-2 subunit alpha n=1 Tax=Massariosphaeria phaeospora TaxID=100035 RepID=A0A7C8M2D3_9PLEO|nr:geranylgeranyl transferase type 2 subunit alpha [Massariosphaeria phaeospora]